MNVRTLAISRVFVALLASACTAQSGREPSESESSGTGALGSSGVDGSSSVTGSTGSETSRSSTDQDVTTESSSGATTGDSAGDEGCPLTDPDCVELPRYGVLELSLLSSTVPAAPFDQVPLRLRVVSPGGQQRTVEGFYDGQDQQRPGAHVWRVRLSCDELGLWTWTAVPGDVDDPNLTGRQGTVGCVPSDDSGGVRPVGRHFERAGDGEPVYLVGNFLDFTGGMKSTHVFMSEYLDDDEREWILVRQLEEHDANKINVYIANVGDYGGDAVTPWNGTAQQVDRSRMNLARWADYDAHIRRFKDEGLLAELWLFADDSDFGSLPPQDQRRLVRYTMARTSAFSHTLYVLALEWQEGFSAERIEELGVVLDDHNPWERPASVHSLTGAGWAFAASTWPGFMATQAGNSATARDVNEYGIELRGQDERPHVDEEYGILEEGVEGGLRSNNWANFASGAAGGGTGSDLAALQRFISQARLPWPSMEPHNELVASGGSSRFCLAEPGHHYLVYDRSGAFSLELEGTDLEALWFNPRDPAGTVGAPFPVTEGEVNFTPPSQEDWVLWVTDSTGLTGGATHVTAGSVLKRVAL